MFVLLIARTQVFRIILYLSFIYLSSTGWMFDFEILKRIQSHFGNFLPLTFFSLKVKVMLPEVCPALTKSLKGALKKLGHDKTQIILILTKESSTIVIEAECLQFWTKCQLTLFKQKPCVLGQSL